MAGNFFPTRCALIGYFEATCHLAMKLFTAKMADVRVTVGNSLNITGNGSRWSTFMGNSTLLPCTDVDQRLLLPVRFNEFPVSI